MTTPRVVCVDDEPSFAELTVTQLERHADVTAEAFTNPDSVLERLDGDDVACIVSDYDMPERTGLELLDAVRERNPDLPFVLFTGKGSEAVASDAISKGVTEYLQKSTDASQYEVLGNRVENAIDRYVVKRELDQQRTLVERIVETTPIGLVVHDGAGDVVVANQRARTLLVMADESLHLRAYDTSDWDLYRSDGTLLTAEDLPVARVLRTGEVIRGESYMLAVGDVRRELTLTAAPLTDDQGRVLYVVAAFDGPEAFGG